MVILQCRSYSTHICSPSYAIDFPIDYSISFSLVEFQTLASPSQQVVYIVGTTSSLLYYSDANIPDSSLRWTTDTVINGADIQYSIEYANPVLLSTVFSDVGAGVQTLSCFYRMSPVTLVGSLQLVIRGIIFYILYYSV